MPQLQLYMFEPMRAVAEERWLMPKIVKMIMIVSEILIGTDSMLEFLG